MRAGEWERQAFPVLWRHHLAGAHRRCLRQMSLGEPRRMCSAECKTCTINAPLMCVGVHEVFRVAHSMARLAARTSN